MLNLPSLMPVPQWMLDENMPFCASTISFTLRPPLSLSLVQSLLPKFHLYDCSYLYLFPKSFSLFYTSPSPPSTPSHLSCPCLFSVHQVTLSSPPLPLPSSPLNCHQYLGVQDQFLQHYICKKFLRKHKNIYNIQYKPTTVASC